MRDLMLMLGLNDHNRSGGYYSLRLKVKCKKVMKEADWGRKC